MSKKSPARWRSQKILLTQILKMSALEVYFFISARFALVGSFLENISSESSYVALGQVRGGG